ncbi:MAG TPA: glycogen debranching protein GlgX, partial [Rudaea sp.]
MKTTLRALRLQPGRPYPLGAHWDGLGINFAVFSTSATAIDLCLFDAAGRHEIARMPLPECTNEVWHGYLPDLAPPVVYGYRAYGPYEPERGFRFNPHKLLLDPYARELVGELRWSDALFGYRVNSPKADLSFDRRDSASAMPNAVVTVDAFNWGDDRLPAVPWSDTVIYEAHVRGVSKLRRQVHGYRPGTVSALAEPRFISHLKRLGVTTIELLPIHAFVNDRFLLERGLANYWGYNTLAFFVPAARYMAGGGANDLRVAIRRLHAAGIEVILDVVYNHTAEGNELGPTLSLRGLDNTSYYRLPPETPRHYINDTGCGNAVNISHPRVMQMVLDSLRYWATSYRVDGFRFDLGATLGREVYGFDEYGGFFDALLQDPVLSSLKLIAEPWDTGLGGYQLGHFPPGFSEWNDRYRDTVRRFWRGDEGQIGELAGRMSASRDIFGHRARKPSATINFLTSHDGFTLEDVVSYEQRHNDANGDGNTDGHNENYSRNWGAEGPTEDDGVLAARARVKRGMLMTVLLSQGTPMLLAGDEFGQTQHGNNNAYSQDNEIAWLDWSLLDKEPNRQLLQFVQRITAVRRRFHVLRANHFLDGERELVPGIAEVAWFDAAGNVMTEDVWKAPGTRTLAVR